MNIFGYLHYMFQHSTCSNKVHLYLTILSARPPSVLIGKPQTYFNIEGRSQVCHSDQYPSYLQGVQYIIFLHADVLNKKLIVSLICLLRWSLFPFYSSDEWWPLWTFYSHSVNCLYRSAGFVFHCSSTALKQSLKTILANQKIYKNFLHELNGKWNNVRTRTWHSLAQIQFKHNPCSAAPYQTWLDLIEIYKV